MMNNKHVITTIATSVLTLLMISSAFFVFSNSTASAQTPSYSTYAFLTLSTNPVGVGQTLDIVFWLSFPPPTAAGASGDRWQNLTVTVTEPNGNTQTLGPFNSDPVGSAYTIFTPTETGTYYFQMHFPGQQINAITFIGVPINAYYGPSTSEKVALTVQQQQAQPYPQTSLPTGYWENPVSANNKNWWSISGNWLGIGLGSFGAGRYDSSAPPTLSANFAPYTKAPNSAHIVWKKAISMGGLIGGEYGSEPYYTGNAYENRFQPPVIINGILYYDTPNAPFYGFNAVNLRTGETLWYNNDTGNPKPNTYGYESTNAITFGQIYDYTSPNQYGGLPYLWGINTHDDGSTTYSMYDAITGNWILNLANASQGVTTSTDSVGDILMYLIGPNWLAMWNSSKAIPTQPLSVQPNGYWLWRPPLGATLNWNDGIQWNVTSPVSLPGQSIESVDSGVIISSTVNLLLPGPGWFMDAGYSATTGQQMWVQNRTGIAGATGWSVPGPQREGVYTEFTKETLTWKAFDVMTGKELWTSDPTTNAWSMYLSGATIAYGKLYSLCVDGLHAYDLKTGHLLWNYSPGSSGTETAYGVWPFDLGGFTIADGKVYIVSGHSHLVPLFSGATLYAIDANTGQLLWSILGWLQSSWENPPIIADGYMVTYNNYDGALYCFGKGLTATTVSAPDTAIPQGTAVLIRGTVTDQSPGQTSMGVPAKGTPAISDDSMSAWMEYLYEQQPIPDHATGVPVTLTAVDSNHNTINIGTTTSDNTGSFHITWTPPATGEYTIIASFGGSNSYFASSTETGLAVAAATSSSSAPLDLYIIVATIIIIIAIAIVGILVLRKRP